MTFDERSQPCWRRWASRSIWLLRSWDIVAALRLREAEERRRIVQWVNDHFASSPPGVCAHCGGGAQPDDPFVLLFVGTDRGEVHANCYSAWQMEREAEAREALRIDLREGD